MNGVCGRPHVRAPPSGTHGSTPPRLDPCVPKGGARTWGRPETPFKVGDRVQARWGKRWFAGVVEEVVEGGYEVAWADEETSNEIPAKDVRRD